VEESKELELPRDLEFRLFGRLVEDIDSRLKDVTNLVALQETELVILWCTIIGLTTYIVGKDYRARQRTN
jgi:hypothetical protein